MKHVRRTTARRLVFFLLLLCIVHSFATKHQEIPDQISSARTVAVVTHVGAGRGRYLEESNSTAEAQLTAEAQQALRGTPSLSVVGEPNEADLVLLLVMADWKTQYGEDLGLIFPGGAHPDAAPTIPLWVGEGQSGFSAVEYFLAQSKKQQKSATDLHLIFPGRRASKLRSRSGSNPAAGSEIARPFPQELLRAKTIALVGYSPDQPWGTRMSHPFPKGSLGRSLEKWKRFKIVDNAQDADLIFVIYIDTHQEYDVDSEGCGSFSRDRCGNYSREALIVFSNTRPPDWTAVPLWMEQVDEKEYKFFSVKLDLIHVLREDLKRAEATKN